MEQATCVHEFLNESPHFRHERNLRIHLQANISCLRTWRAQEECRGACRSTIPRPGRGPQCRSQGLLSTRSGNYQVHYHRLVQIIKAPPGPVRNPSHVQCATSHRACIQGEGGGLQPCAGSSLHTNQFQSKTNKQNQMMQQLVEMPVSGVFPITHAWFGLFLGRNHNLITEPLQILFPALCLLPMLVCLP